MKYKIKAQNIRCEGCVTKIKENIGKLEGIHQVEVNIEDATVIINADDNRSKKMYTDRLKEIGYPEQNTFFSGLKKIFSN